MASEPGADLFPRDSFAEMDLHTAVASALGQRLQKLGDALALMFGEDAAHAVIRALLIDTRNSADHRAERSALFNRKGWREFLREETGDMGYSLEATLLWREGAGYAGQGLISEPSGQTPSLEERKVRIKALLARGRIALDCGWSLLGDEYDYIWKGVDARAAIDFGGTVTIEGLHLLSGLPLAAVRTAVSIGDLHPDEAGTVSAEEARTWLARRRDFCPSRWLNLTDDQKFFDPDEFLIPDNKGMILVPQATEGEAFVPDLVVRPTRSGGISITVGAKGEEVQHHNFYEALTALAKMDVARWRRRNGAGNWGIVRARGAWIAVSKAEIDRQLAAKLAEAS